jgi:hypothetical protein
VGTQKSGHPSAWKKAEQKAFGETNRLTWRCTAMMTYLNNHAQPPFQALHGAMDASAAIFPARGAPFMPRQQENFIGEITLCHLDAAPKLEKVQALREHINLPSGCRDAEFFEQEKKETKWGLCLRLSSTAS